MGKSKQARAVRQLVVIGSSAGGIDALSRFLSHLPPEFPAPIVIAQHLDPHRASHLQTILQGPSGLPVTTVTDRTPLVAGTVYVVPASQNVAITDHDVSLKTPGSGFAPKPSIDLLFASAATIFQENLVAVVLTGTGSDGAAGAQEVKRAGGTVIIQDPRSAQFPALPLSLAPTVVDLALPVEEMGPKIHDLLMEEHVETSKGDDSLMRVLKHVEQHSAIDFANHKRPTIVRRLKRRMVATNKPTIDEYLGLLEIDPQERRSLVDSFLIKVTEFFRDEELFTALREVTLPAVIDYARTHDGDIRVWSAGCATGEEAYSVAILLTELLGDDLSRFHVRIFATDLDGPAIEFARRGLYPTSSVKSVPDEILAQHFTFNGSEYQIKKNIRSMMVFGQHDLADQPPFPRIDLLICRNVLIYFGPELQRHVLRLFAFSLRQDGYLVLGKSENVTFLSDFFVGEDSHLKVFRRTSERATRPPRFPDTMRAASDGNGNPPVPSLRVASRPQRDTTDRKGRPGEGDARWAPVFQQIPHGVVIVDRRYNILYINMAARHLLGIYGPAIGEDLVHLAQHIPSPLLRRSLDRVFQTHEPAPPIPISFVEPPDPASRHVDVVCQSFETEADSDSGPLAIVTVLDVTSFREQVVTAERDREERKERSVHAAGQLAGFTDLISDLRKANDELTADNLELRRANEEFLAGNEELQAGAAEVEILNEELQASNEELETLNEELSATVEELNATNEDLHARGNELETTAGLLEEARRLSESERARLEAVLVSMADAVAVVDKNAEMILTNRAFRLAFGEGTKEFVTMDAEGRPVPPELQPQQRAARGEAFATEFTIDGEAGRVYYEVIGRSIQAGSELEGGMLVIRDITDRSLRRLQDEFMALASHELRTPLTVLRGYLALLGRERYNDERRREFAALADEQALRIERLTYDLLDVVRLESGQLSLYEIPADLNELLSRCVTTVRSLYEDREFVCSPAAKPVEIRGDPDRLEQVFLNILLNAAKFTPAGGRIEATVQRRKSWAVVRIKDTGQGIEEGDVPYVFSRFFRSRGSSLARSSGLGLGLYIARELVTAHRGEIEVESEPGQGATFTVRLPLATETSQVTAGQSEPENEPEAVATGRSQREKELSPATAGESQREKEPSPATAGES